MYSERTNSYKLSSLLPLLPPEGAGLLSKGRRFRNTLPPASSTPPASPAPLLPLPLHLCHINKF